MRHTLLGLTMLGACQPDPRDELDQRTDFRVGLEPGDPVSGERGTIVIGEVLWSGTVRNDGSWDSTDVFVEVRNEGVRPVNLSGWHLIMTGVRQVVHRFPDSEVVLGVGEHRFMAAKSDGCFPEPDWVVPALSFSYGDSFMLTLRDADERLMDAAGSRTMPPYGGGYDGVVSRSMEKVSLMFGGRGTEPHSWHFYNRDDVDVPNNQRMLPACRQRTGASPGQPNSPDYSGAFASGDFE